MLPSQASAQNDGFKKYHIADSLFRKQRFDTVLPLLENILTLKTSDSIKAEVLARKGIVLASKNIIDSAIVYYQWALDIFSNEKNFTKQSRICSNIGNLYFSKKVYNQALRYQFLALSYSKLASDSLTQYFSLCQVYEKQADFKNLYNILIKHVGNFKKGLSPNQEYLSMSYFGLYYSDIKMHDSALYFFRKALPATITDRDLSAVYNNLSDEFRIKKDYKKAVLFLDSALYINKKSGNLVSQLYSYDTYVDIYSEIGNPTKALEYSQLARKISDSNYTIEQINALQDDEVKYQTTKKEEINKLQAKDIALKNRAFTFSLIGLFLVALLTAITFRSYKQKQKANNILTIQRNQVQQLANELNEANQTKARLFSTISHDLRSPISSLYATLKMAEIKAAENGGNSQKMSEQTIHLLDTLEDLLMWSKSQMERFELFPSKNYLPDVYEELKSFYAVMAASKNVTINNTAAESTTVFCDENILKTLLRNALANAINNAPPYTTVTIATLEKDNLVQCQMKNQCSEAGFVAFKNSFENAGIQSQSHGFGLILIKEFAQKINAPVNLFYENGEAVISISIPKK